MEIIENTLHVAWALRWVLVAIAFGVLGAMYAESVHQNRAKDNRIEKLRRSNEFLVAQNRALSARAGRRRPIIAGRVVNQ